MEQKFMNESVFREHSRMCDERFRRDKEDIARINGEVMDLKELTVEIAALVKKNDDTLEKHDKRLVSLEHKPSVWIDRIISAVISTVIAAVVSGGMMR